MSENYLVISDLQIPFEAEHALKFAREVRKFFRVPPENCLCVGDETDQYFGSGYKKNPNAKHTPHSEIEDAKDRLRQWYSYFPQMKVAISNHGVRYWKKALEAELPSQLIREYREVIEAPEGWVWKQSWVFKNLKKPFRMIHGMGYSGQNGHRAAALDAGISTVIGHLHAHAGVAHIITEDNSIWGMNSGCLIDLEAYAFEYGRDHRYKPALGLSVVLDSGRTPIWIPYRY